MPPPPEDRLSVSAFAARAGLSAKTLRRYSDAGLVKPTAVDPISRREDDGREHTAFASRLTAPRLYGPAPR